ncbi:hypothetical protein [Marinifilum fragile]|uniref:hypothetical protein n=1 Tax=Marinifilum fragile TaxID=570161 RepID=UPI002AA8DBFB|nr:hypothetical protein [Marinifilum fragile]
MKSRQLFLLVIVAFFLFLRCTEQKEQVHYTKMSFEQLFNYFLTTQDSSDLEKVEHLLDDSLVKYPFRFFYPSERIDSLKQEVVFTFKLAEEDYDYNEDYKIKMRNLFLIHIDKKNVIHAKREKISNCDSIIDDMIFFIKNDNDDDNLPEKRIAVVELLDTIQISKAYFTLISQSQPDSLKQRTDWLIVKRSISSILSAYKLVKNNAAVSYWNRNYNELNFKQKKSISQLYPINIWFYPNPTNLDWLALPIPPHPSPPPSPILSKEILDIIYEDELEE